MIDKFHVYMCLHIASIKSTAGKKVRFFSSSFLISTSWFLILAEALRNDDVAGFSTAVCSAIEKYEMGGCITVPCTPKMTQRISTVDQPKF